MPFITIDDTIHVVLGDRDLVSSSKTIGLKFVNDDGSEVPVGTYKALAYSENLNGPQTEPKVNLDD
jgi:hypothetical protein